MSIKAKIVKELKAVFWTSLYFLAWFGGLMVVKVLLLREYKIEFFGASIVVLAALVAAKAVLILENVRIVGTSRQSALVVLIKRTLLYLAGIFVILVFEKIFETRNEYGGLINAFKNLAGNVDGYHILVNIICVFGALFFFNTWTVIKKYLGEGGMRKIMLSPISEDKNEKKQ